MKLEKSAMQSKSLIIIVEIIRCTFPSRNRAFTSVTLRVESRGFYSQESSTKSNLTVEYYL